MEIDLNLKDKLDVRRQIFNVHYNYYKNIGIETIKQQSGQVEQVSSDYQGRVIYELLQNAFDKAEEKILVEINDGILYIANDGQKFTYVANYDYLNGGSERGDFQSLCSISTSTKTVEKNIGNKGVGFKSSFSVAKKETVSIYTKGKVISDSAEFEQDIHFKLCSSFTEDNLDFKEFDEDIKNNITEKLRQVAIERPDRGIPGYYFPLQLSVTSSHVNQLFNDGYVTIIAIEFVNQQEIESLFNEIKDIHFRFISLKFPNNFNIEFKKEDDLLFTKNVVAKDNTLFTAKLNNSVQELAEKAGVQINQQQVAIKFKDSPTGVFYNYLPTKVNSPFKYVDFHADFHTTVDRKEINFDGGKIGAYNCALLDACVELYFSVISSYSNTEEKLFEPTYLESFSAKLHDFNWHYIDVGDASRIYDKTKKLFNINDVINQHNIGSKRHYKNLVGLLSSLAKHYFKQTHEKEKHKLFFENILKFISSFTNDYNTRYSRADEFKTELFETIRDLNAKVIPSIDFEKVEELFYRKKGGKDVKLPNSISIKITDFEITDTTIKSALNIKEFSDSNEILKHFLQCSFLGEVNDAEISESDQKALLKSCYLLYQSKREVDYISTHRYTTIFTAELRDKNSTSNQANFSVSTLFLKLKNGRFKPAQLCTKDELDKEFLDFCESDLDKWLRFLGVSTETNYRFVDRRIYENQKDGLAYIPKLLVRQEMPQTIKGELLRYIHIVDLKGQFTHPAIINNNNYSFLKNFSNRKLKKELDSLCIAKDSNYPREYFNILKEKMDKYLNTDKNNIIRFYQSVFEVFAKQNFYLVIQDGILKWSKNTDFYALTNKADFELAIEVFKDKQILAYYSGGYEKFKDKLKNKFITPIKGKVNYTKKTNDFVLKKVLSEKFPYILINLSHSRDSEVNYLSEEVTLISLQEKFEKMEIYTCDNLEQSLNFPGLGTDSSPKDYAINEAELFLSNISSKSQWTQGICDFLFNNISIKEQVELILLHKEIDDLKNETNPDELSLINGKWKVDYQNKFKEYQNKILSSYNRSLNGNESWYRYSKENINSFLIERQQNNQLDDLVRDINKYKRDYDGYFDDFKLQIDYSHINKDIAILQTHLDSTEVDKELKERMLKLIRKGEERILGIEVKIKELKENFPHIFEINESEEKLKAKEAKLQSQQSINEIYKKIKHVNLKEIEEKNLNASNQRSRTLDRKTKQIIFQADSDTSERSMQLEITGASGEVEVLICLINEFIQLSIEERKEGIMAIKKELQSHTKNNVFDKYAEECLGLVNDNHKLKKALIPLLYVSKKFKYANFDLITYKKGKPTLIEVKTTKNIKSKRFYLSIAEVNTARVNQSYEIVRVTPQSIIFMGNPIKKVDQNILEIKTDGFSLKPRNYEFIIN